MKRNTIPVLNDINTGQFVDRCEWWYWDTIYAADGQIPHRIQAFTTPRGNFDPATGRVKTLHETNMISNGSQWGFGATRSLILEEISLYFPLWMSSAQIDALMSSALLRFNIAEKVFFDSRLDIREESQPADVEPVVNTYPDGGTELFQPAEFSGRMVRIKSRAEFAKYIAPTVPFEFALHFDSPLDLGFSGVKPVMVPILKGLMDRAVM